MSDIKKIANLLRLVAFAFLIATICFAGAEVGKIEEAMATNSVKELETILDQEETPEMLILGYGPCVVKDKDLFFDYFDYTSNTLYRIQGSKVTVIGNSYTLTDYMSVQTESPK